MKYNKIVKENEYNKNSFLITCVCSILLLLALCYFGVNSGVKGTYSASKCPTSAPYEISDGLCCKNSTDTIYKYNGVNYCKDGNYTIQTQNLKSVAVKTSQKSGEIKTLDEKEAICNQLGNIWHRYLDSCSYLKTSDVTLCTCYADVTELFAKAQTYNVTVTYNASGGSVSPSSATVSYGSAVTLPTPTRSGYVFTGWFTGSNGSGSTAGVAGGTYKPTSDITLYAKWVEEDRGCYCSGNESSDRGETCLWFPAPPTSPGWTETTDTSKCGSSSGSDDGETDTEKEVTLTLKYGAGVKDGQTYTTKTCTISGSNSNCEIAMITPSLSGYDFIAWANSADCKTPLTSMQKFVISTDYTYYACFEGVGNTAKEQCYSCTGVPAHYWGTSAPSTGCTGGIWSVVDKTESECTGGSGSTSKTVKLTLKYGDGVGKNGQTYTTKTCTISGSNSNCEIAMITPSLSGYDFIAWANSADCKTPLTSMKKFVISTDYTYYACYEKKPSGNGGGGGGTTPTEETHTVTFDPNGGSLVGNSSDSCTTTGSSCTISSLPTATRTDYTFEGWGTSKTCTSGDKSSITLNSDKTYYACWEKVSNNPQDDPKDDPNNVPENPVTGQTTTIAIIWFVGLLAIGYAFYYFKSVKEN